MTKVALPFLFLGLVALATLPAAAQAQDNSTAIAVNEAVLRQANTIVLRQKLAEARAVSQRGDVAGAAKLYQECCDLVQKIGSGIDAEAAQAVSGLTSTRLTLAREYQSHGDYRNAQLQVQQILKVAPKNPEALAFKKQNDQMLEAMKGRMPSKETLDEVPQIAAQKTDAATLVQDGKLLYEMGKLDEAEIKLHEAVKLNPDNSAAYYYLNLIQQAKFARESAQHTVDTQHRMAEVEKKWVLPTSKNNLPVPNPYATNTMVWTGPGRQAIIAKLDKIHLDNVSYDGLPLSEVLRNLSEQSKLRDPERKGVNFLINPNPDQSGQPVAAATTGGLGGAYGGYGAVPGAAAPAIDPTTGLPATTPLPAAGGSSAEAVDVGSFIVKIPSLSDVRLADVLDAIVMVSDHPVKYSVQDFAVVFSAKGPETPQLFSRTFKVDPNTFYSGLESVGAQSFGSSGGNNGGGGGGGGGGSRGGGGGGNSGGNNQNSGAVVGVVNAFSGAGSLRSTGNGQGGGGGGGQQGGVGANLGGTINGGGAGATGGGNGGLRYITTINPASDVSVAARAFFTTLGVNLENPPGKSIFFNDRLGKLFVKATAEDLDTIERAIEALNEVAPQVHIKARFIEVAQDDSKSLGFDWYLGQFNANGSGSVVAQGGSSASLYNGSQYFPGPTTANIIPTSASDQLVTGGLRNSAPAVGTITGILTDPNFRMVIHALEQRSGYESLAEPEVTTTSGRQTQMRATQVQTIITDVNFEQGASASTGNTGTTTQ